MKYTFLFIIVLLTGCRNAWVDPDKEVWIDMNDTTTSTVEQSYQASKDIVRVAIASMTTPVETMYKYDQMFSYLEKRLNKKIVLVQRKSYKEVNDLLENNELDMAFICSGAYVAGMKDSAFKIFLNPMHNKEIHYHAYVITKKDSPFKNFSDLAGKKFVYSDSLSNTGMYYPLKKINELGIDPDSFFSKTYLSNAHNNSMALVNRGIVDATSVNSLIFDYIKKVNPEKVSNIKIIEVSEPFGMPPLVVSNHIDSALYHELHSILTGMDKDPEGNKILRGLMIDKYVDGTDSNYNSIREMCKSIGYPNIMAK